MDWGIEGHCNSRVVPEASSQQQEASYNPDFNILFPTFPFVEKTVWYNELKIHCNTLLCIFVLRIAMNYQDIIQTNASSASVEFVYRGSPEAGMLAWLDSRELQLWWKAHTAIIEPFHGGMFYITWHEDQENGQHAIYGIMEKVETINNIIEINKIMYISPAAKMGHLHLHLSFTALPGGLTAMNLVHTHNYSGQLLTLYNEAVFNSWPQTFALLKKHLEKNDGLFQ